MMTTAQEISSLLEDDGQRFETRDGIEIDYLCKAKRPERTFRDGYGTDTYRYDFADGSAIVITDAAWDLAPEGCTGFCWADAGCECPVEGAEVSA
jgi:hypothetical protein